MAYGNDDEFTAWLTSQGLALPTGAPLPAVLRQIGSSYVDAAYGHKLTCSSKAGGVTQEMAWPRKGHVLNGEVVPDDYIPTAWVQAAYRAGYLSAVTPGWATDSVNPNRITVKERVDVIEREFAKASDLIGTADVAAGMNADGVINGMLQPWLCSGSRRFNSLFMVI